MNRAATVTGLPIGLNPLLVQSSGAGLSTFINNDPVNTIWLGFSSSITTSGTNSIPLLPQSSIMLTGVVYAVSNVANAGPLSIISGSVYYNPGSNLGLSQLLNPASQNINPSGFFTSDTVNVTNFSGWDLQVLAYCGLQANVGAPLACQVTLSWFADAAGLIPLYRERWAGWLGNGPATSSPMLGSGKHHGPYMNITVFNPGSTEPMTLQSLILWGTGRDVPVSFFSQTPPSTMNPGIAGLIPTPGSDGADNTLFEVGNLAVTSGQKWMPLPLHAGRLWIRYSIATALATGLTINNGNALTNGVLGTGPNTPGCLYNFTNVAGNEFDTTIIAPRSPLWLSCVGAAGGSLITVSIEGDTYA